MYLIEFDQIRLQKATFYVNKNCGEYSGGLDGNEPQMTSGLWKVANRSETI